MARAESANDEGLANQKLNKIQVKKVREIIAACNGKPADALYHIKEYCAKISKISVHRVTFENQEAPTGINIHILNSVYFFRF